MLATIRAGTGVPRTGGERGGGDDIELVLVRHADEEPPHAIGDEWIEVQVQHRDGRDLRGTVLDDPRYAPRPRAGDTVRAWRSPRGEWIYLHVLEAGPIRDTPYEPASDRCFLCGAEAVAQDPATREGRCAAHPAEPYTPPEPDW